MFLFNKALILRFEVILNSFMFLKGQYMLQTAAAVSIGMQVF
jgi:hypothetical protein